MIVRITNITPWHPTSVRLQWELDQVTESGTFSFDVERSGSPGGPWTTITTVSLPDTYTYDDLFNTGEEANTLSLARDIYYRILAEPPSGPSNKVYSNIVNLDGLTEYELSMEEPGNPVRPIPVAQYEQAPQTHIYKHPEEAGVRQRLYKRALMRNMYLMLKHLNGTEYKLLKRRHFGTRCDCYDQITRELIISNCTTCYGTSWVGGFYTPLDILARIVRGSTGHIQSQLSAQTKDDINFPQIQTLDFPKIDEGDILVAVSQNRRFLVKQRYNTSLKNVVIHQTLGVTELPRSAVEYKIDAGI